MRRLKTLLWLLFLLNPIVRAKCSSGKGLEGVSVHHPYLLDTRSQYYPTGISHVLRVSVLTSEINEVVTKFDVDLLDTNIVGTNPFGHRGKVRYLTSRSQ